jgi:5-methylcytosine-specific restriction protein A
VAFHITYKLDALPPEDKLSGDLLLAIDLYETLISRGGVDNVETALAVGFDAANDDAVTIEERRRYVRHARIERSSKASALAKRRLGSVCQACGFDFEGTYGEVGRDFIEAPHLIRNRPASPTLRIF